MTDRYRIISINAVIVALGSFSDIGVFVAVCCCFITSLISLLLPKVGLFENWPVLDYVIAE